MGCGQLALTAAPQGQEEHSPGQAQRRPGYQTQNKNPFSHGETGNGVWAQSPPSFVDASDYITYIGDLRLRCSYKHHIRQKAFFMRSHLHKRIRFLFADKINLQLTCRAVAQQNSASCQIPESQKCCPIGRHLLRVFQLLPSPWPSWRATVRRVVVTALNSIKGCVVRNAVKSRSVFPLMPFHRSGFRLRKHKCQSANRHQRAHDSDDSPLPHTLFIGNSRLFHDCTRIRKLRPLILQFSIPRSLNPQPNDLC